MDNKLEGKSKDYNDLAEQIQIEYNLAEKHIKPKREVNKRRLKVYNNQKKDDDAVGDTTLFSTMQTVVASLYIDRLNVKFDGWEEGDDDVANNITDLSEYDYTAMGKDELDFNWIWDTCFFGRSVFKLEEFKRDPKKNIFLPIPSLVDSLLLLRDPLATSLNGDRNTGAGAARFWGHDARMSKEAMQDNKNFFDDINYDELRYGSSTFSLMQEAIEARDDAQNRQDIDKIKQESSLGANANYDVTVWYTHYNYEGKVQKVKVWLGNQRSSVLGIQKVGKDYWRAIDRALYPTSNDWDGTSIPDLVEDKQRARAIAVNLGMKAMQADLYPMYVYDKNRIPNKKNLKFGLDKFIPVDLSKGGNLNDLLQPMNKAKPNLPLLNFIFTSLDLSGQKATATPDIQQGLQSEKDRPLGETNLIQANTNTRYSLAAKIFGWSEWRFWQQWYQMYKDNYSDGGVDGKILRLEGAFGNSWRKLDRKDIITEIDPDIKIVSRVLSRAKQLEDRQSLTAFFTLAFQDVNTNKRYGLRKLGEAAYGLKKDELDRLFPPTIDERIAEEENDKLSNDDLAMVKAEDDHNVHLIIHNKAKDTKAKYAHIKTHEMALSIKKVKPEFFPPDQNVNQMPVMGSGTGGNNQLGQPSLPAPMSQDSGV